MDKLEKNIKDISNNYYQYLINLQNVNGIGYGYKYIGNKNTFEPCIHVLVENKLNRKYISQNNLIPKTYMGIKTDVIDIGKIHLENTLVPREYLKTRPLQGGACINTFGHDIYGTICCIVKKKVKKTFNHYPYNHYYYNYYILSNNHVLVDNGTYPIGSSVLQPTPNNINKIQLSNLVGVIASFIKIKTFKGILGLPNFVDCCIAKVIDNSLISNKLLGLNKITGVTKAKLGMSALKTGAYTNVEEGTVKTLHSTHMMKNMFDDGKNALFVNQIDLDMESDAGDSGSPVLTTEGELIGMHLGGYRNSNGKNTAVSNDINNVFHYLKVKPYLGESLVYKF